MKYLEQLLQKNRVQNHAAKMSFLNIIMGIIMVFCFTTISLFITGLVQIHMGLYDILKFDSQETNDLSLFVKGLTNILITLALFFSLHLFINKTLRKKEWWKRLFEYFNPDTKSSTRNYILKRNVIAAFQTFYGLMMLVGIITVIFGIVVLNIIDNTIFNIISCIIIFIGIIPIFWAYWLYQSDMEKFTQLIVPIFPVKDNDN
jgi:hypothetical protein